MIYVRCPICGYGAVIPLAPHELEDLYSVLEQEQEELYNIYWCGVCISPISLYHNFIPILF